jgi:hypothetical protein
MAVMMAFCSAAMKAVDLDGVWVAQLAAGRAVQSASKVVVWSVATMAVR